MHYQVSRNGQMYGPYTLEDLQRYVASGNVLPADMAKSEEMPEWQTVAQILGMPAAAAPGYAPLAGYSGAPAAAYAGPAGINSDPPNLNWILLLLLGIVTCGIFTIVYEIIQLVWLRKVQPQTQAPLYYILFIVCWALNFGTTFSRLALMNHGIYEHPPLGATFFSALTSLGLLAFIIAYRFAMRSSLELYFNTVDPIGLRLGPIMTLFFGSLYFQYHFNRINTIKQALRYRNPVA